MKASYLVVFVAPSSTQTQVRESSCRQCVPDKAERMQDTALPGRTSGTVAGSGSARSAPPQRSQTMSVFQEMGLFEDDQFMDRLEAAMDARDVRLRSQPLTPPVETIAPATVATPPRHALLPSTELQTCAPGPAARVQQEYMSAPGPAARAQQEYMSAPGSTARVQQGYTQTFATPDPAARVQQEYMQTLAIQAQAWWARKGHILTPEQAIRGWLMAMQKQRQRAAAGGGGAVPLEVQRFSSLEGPKVSG